jgi:hypothetical protein
MCFATMQACWYGTADLPGALLPHLTQLLSFLLLHLASVLRRWNITTSSVLRTLVG